MKLIPTYTWTKGLHTMSRDGKKFMEQPWAAGVTLVVCVIIAMLLANLPFTKDAYWKVLHTPLSMSIGDVSFPDHMTVGHFINDILMVVFFFTVGLEIKREVVCGELSSVKKAMLPVIGALGGMAAPAIIFTLFNHGTDAASGWGIPTATDIAFAVGIMSIMGDRVPVSLKVFLTALAVADDLGAILVVAFFYGQGVNLLLLTIALAIVALVLMMNRMGEKRMAYYLVPAIAVWFLFYYAGIESTMSGVVMALMIPMEPRYNKAYFRRKNKEYLRRLEEYEEADGTEEEDFPNGPQRHCLRRISHVASNSMGMSYRLEHALSPWVNFGIMPLFAIANAGVEIHSLSELNIFQVDPTGGSVGMGIFFGLLLGKPIGITIASWLAIKLGVGAMPSNASWTKFVSVACLGGIGFTMSIFVDTLSFTGVEHMELLRDMGKVAVLMGSVSAGILGSLLIHLFTKKAPATKE